MAAPAPRWSFHGTAVVRSYDDALAWLDRMVGCKALEYSDNDDPMVARSGGVTWLVDNGLELMQPRSPEGAPGRFLARFGPGVFAYALQVDDLAETCAQLEAAGAPPVGDREQGFVFTHPRDTCGIYLEWADEPWDFDPRFGAPMPEPGPPPRIDAPRLAWWSALVDDPAAVAKRLRELCDLAVLVDEPDAPPDRVAAVLSVSDGAIALFRRPDDPAETARLWGPGAPERDRLHAIGMRVRDLDAARAVLREEGVRIVRDDPQSVVSDARDTHGIPLVWTQSDLPGDPRGPLA